MNLDEAYMQQALALAEQGRYSCSPNPMVGCIIVKNNQIMGKGFHLQAGKPHAEINALNDATNLDGATLYVNLEPCCHTGRTPPCTDAIIKAGITRVVIACEDPNPLVAGHGISQLRAAGIQVDIGILGEQARELNKIFFYYITQNKPYVIAKWAMSLDGRTKTNFQDNKKISGDDSHRQSHQLRRQVDAILIGSGTAIDDNPQLTARLDNADSHKQPARIILSSKGKLPGHLIMFNKSREAKTIIAVTDKTPANNISALKALTDDVLVIKQNKHGLVCLNQLLAALAEMNISSLLVEGGQRVHDAFLEAGLVNEVMTFISPVIIGSLEKKQPVKITHQQQIGDDYLITATLGN